MFNEGKLEKYTRENYNKIKEYNIMDVKTLSELFFKTKKEIKRLCDVNLENHITLASMSYDIFIKLNKKNKVPSHSSIEKYYIRSSVYGGRAQVFNRGEYNKEQLCCIDCVSLYPYVMLNNKFPLGKSKVTEEYIKNSTGVYEINIKNLPEINIIPLRSKYKVLDWKKKEIKCIVTSEDLETLMKYKCDIEIIKGMYWEKDTKTLFKSYFEPIVKEKTKQDKAKGTEKYNPAVREICKLLMNSLSGKLIQRDYEDIIKIIKSKEELNNFKQKCREGIEVIDINETYSIVSGTLQENNNKMPIIYGSLIYSYARSHMYNTIISKVNYKELFGMDTDSAFITKRQYEELKEKYPSIFGDEFGQFREEILEYVGIEEQGPFGIFVSPKCYCFYKINKKGKEEFIKARFKGINLDRDKIWKKSLCFENIDIRELNKLYHGDELEKINVEFYRKCLTEEVMILHSNLSKKVFDKKDYIGIKQHFCIKNIKPQ